MGHRSDRDRLRGDLYGADVGALVDALTASVWPEDALQLLGDAVLVVAREHVEVVEPATRRCVAALRDRGWEGDSELADQIDAALGRGRLAGNCAR